MARHHRTLSPQFRAALALVIIGAALWAIQMIGVLAYGQPVP